MPFLFARLAGLLGCGLILLSIFLPWFRVPVDVEMVRGMVRAVTIEPPITTAIRVICVAVCAMVAALFLFSKRPGNHAADLAVALLIVQLFYPYLVLTWSPRESAAASWLQMQHENISWLGGDLYTAAELRNAQFKTHVAVVDPPGELKVFHIPSWTPQSVQWGRVPEVLEWLGYSTRFCQFVHKGWPISLAGSVLLIFGLCRDREGVNLPRARRVARRTLVGVGAGGILALLPIMIAGTAVVHSRDSLERGDYASSLRFLKQAGKILPIILQDTTYIEQQGLLESRLSIDSPEAALFRAKILYKQGFSASADQLYQELAAGEATPVSREALRSVLRAGIQDLDSGLASAAAKKFEFVLAREPANLKANYALELACLRLGEYARLDTLAEEMAAIYRPFNAKNVKPVLAMAWENQAMAEYLQGRPNQSLAAWKKVQGR